MRLHQRAFRERVLAAYQVQCAFCRLRHEELLDAAHIIPDVEPAGEPLIRNGLSLCTLHHAAFDRYFIGIRPDFTLEVREDLRREKDGPTLVHAIQALHGSRIILPRRVDYRPAVELLEQRYERFQKAQAGLVYEETVPSSLRQFSQLSAVSYPSKKAEVLCITSVSSLPGCVSTRP